MTDFEASTTLPKQGVERAKPGAAALVIVHCPDASAVGQRIVLGPSETPLVAGRDPGAGARISDPHLSRAHFELTWDSRAQCHRLSDRDSANGTFVNGERVDTWTLASNDVLRCGDTLLVYAAKSPMHELLDRMRTAAESRLNVLLQGETGTGKQVQARRLHDVARRTGNFIVLSAGELTPTRAALELFGDRQRSGAFARAAGGTLLLDEVSDLPLQVQPKLLRVVETGLLRPVGSADEVAVDVQVVASTYRDLNEAVRLGTFRDDLLARLSGVTLVVPALRERRAELLKLAVEFSGPEPIELTADAAEAMLLWHYPHNVRELRALATLLTAAKGSARSVGVDLLERVRPELVRRGSFVAPVATGTPSHAGLREKLIALLIEHNGNVSSVSKALSVSRARLYRWLETHGLSADSFRESAEARSLRE